ncbi:MAG TPA: ABC transporter permease [Anaerolineaceae bacterium]|nr:ABC transporter permease [Anaerolineaceae bacterium]
MQSDRTDWVKFILDRFIWFIVLGVFILFAINAPNFLTPLNMINIALHASVLGLMAIGQAICLISGNFDLSAEGTVSLLTVLAAWLMGTSSGDSVVRNFAAGSGWGVNPILVLVLILALGVGIGALNGVMITRLKMNNFIVTLAMQLVLRGLALTLSGGKNISDIPEVFRWLGTGKIGPIPVQIIVTGLLFVVVHYFLKNSRFGRQLYATGGNKEAAFASGFNPKKIITMAYILSGLFAALASWMLLGRVGEATIFLGSGMTLETVAAAVIGGIALSGGYGTIGGVLGGVLLLAVVDNGLNLMTMDPNAVRGVRGLIILIALIIEAQKFRYKSKAMKQAVEKPAGETTEECV